MIVIGIDPGTKESGYVIWNGKEILAKGIPRNVYLLDTIKNRFFPPGSLYAVEGIQYIGKGVGRDVFETCYFIGMLLSAIGCPVGEYEKYLVYRKDVKLFLTGTVKSRDKDIRATLITTLGKEVTKGVSNHEWSALAIAVYYYQTFTSAANLKEREIS